MTSDEGRQVRKIDLRAIFSRSLESNRDFDAWTEYLQGEAPDWMSLHPVTASHLLTIYSPRLANLERKSSPLASSLSRALSSIEARSTEGLYGVLCQSSDSVTYMAWLNEDASELVAYFVGNPPRRG